MRKYLKTKLSLRMFLVLFVFFIMLVTLFIIGTVAFVCVKLGWFTPFQGHNPFIPVVGMLAFSIVLGTVLTAAVSNRTLKPLRKIIDATNQVAAGDFSVRIETNSVPEIEDLTTSFNTMVQELGSIETLRNDFISNFSHEFKTPIVSIRGFAKLLRNKDLPEEERSEYVEIIVQESERLAGLATNVLDLSKLEHTGILVEKQTFFLDEQIRRVAALMEPRWRKKNISLSLEMDCVTISSDEDLLQQVWVNLLDNAIKFTGENGKISLALKKNGDEAAFRLTDNGAGMDEHTLTHLFDKFYQGDKSHSGRGNGLGLSLVKQIITLCDGRIEVESEPQKGSTFVVVLPISL